MTRTLAAGYRLVLTTKERAKTTAIGQASQESGINRADLFLAAQVTIADLSYREIQTTFCQILDDLQTFHLYLCLVQLPRGGESKNWQILCDLYQVGQIRALGVINVPTRHFLEFLESFPAVPAVNQIDFQGGKLPVSAQLELAAALTLTNNNFCLSEWEMAQLSASWLD
ncbi:hypothetical protein HU830_02820 [Lactobacillus sp. DCY120]|uniref:Uncharacterized protein n=1 Tax=Bombilactobacillus apium TaxID=2675299 RepID=A0A850R9P9_9LACO|nr:hypothetical protein [Bombilactobacillus apium]NVY96116.1 hypothetical protein [Bombilactobacillus apium]